MFRRNQRGKVSGAIYQRAGRRPPVPIDLVKKVVQQVVKSGPKEPPKTGGFLESVTKDLATTFKAVANNPTFIAVIAIVAVIVVTHAGEIDGGPLAPFFPKESTNVFVKWVRTNVGKFFGALAFVPVVIASPTDYQALVSVLTGVWIFLAPVFSEYQYGAQAVLLYFYFAVKGKNTKFLLVAIAFAIWMLGLMVAVPAPTTGTGTTPPTNPPPAPAPAPKRAARSLEDADRSNENLLSLGSLVDKYGNRVLSRHVQADVPHPPVVNQPGPQAPVAPVVNQPGPQAPVDAPTNQPSGSSSGSYESASTEEFIKSPAPVFKTP